MDLQFGAFRLSPENPDLTSPHLLSHSMGKGDKVLIPIYAMNTDKDIWGNDALEFKCVFNSVPSLFKWPLILSER